MIKHTFKDSVFRYTFKIKKYAADLYYDISGKQISSDEIEYVDSENFVMNELRNDIAFMKSDNSLIVLLEHQSSTNYNMDIRLLSYYIKLIQSYINRTYKYGLHTSQKIVIPKAECYVLYNGSAIMDDSDLYRTPFIINDREFNLNTKFININFDCLEQSIRERKDALGAYALLIKLYHEFNQSLAKENLYDDLDVQTEKAYEMAVKQCQTMGYNLEIFKREEFKTMTMMTLSIQEDMQIKYEAGVERGVEQERKAIAQNMLSSGMDASLVSQYTGLSEEKLNKLLF